MTKPFLTPFTLLSSVALLASALSAAPQLATDCGLDYWSLPSLLCEIQNERQRNREFDARWQEALERAARRNQVVDDILAGRTSLAEAIAVFRELDHCSSGRRLTEIMFPGKTRDESLARHVIYRARCTLTDRNQDATEVTQHLEAELRQFLAQQEAETTAPR